ncbi:MAG: HAD family hydrolase [Planctomycetota bacterium]|nr:HAD family hydrolase [Planctomycetota bacterium]
MSLSAVVFDLDGTLLDTLEDLADSMNKVLTDAGYPAHPVDPYRYFVGDGMENLARRAAPVGTDDKTVKALAANMGAVYEKNWRNKTRPYSGVIELLDRIGNAGISMAVLSNKPDVFTQAMVKHYFGDDCFRAVNGQMDGVPKKPDPAGAIAIANAFGIPRERFLYLGDTNTDMLTGVAAGMRTIGVSWGFRPVEELNQAGAKGIIDHPLEALGLLGIG